MGENNPNQPIKNIELQTALSEATDVVSGFAVDEEQKHSTEVAVREHFGGLESAETVRKANALYREFVEERGYDPHPTLVAAVGNAMVHFPDAETTGVIMFKELFDAGDLAVNEVPAQEDLDTIGHYLIEGDRFGLGETDVRKVADALGIPKMIRGLELVQTMAGKMEEGEITAKLLFDLGIIDSETYEKVCAAEEEITEGDSVTATGEYEDEDSELEYEDLFDDVGDEEAEDVSEVDIL